MWSAYKEWYEEYDVSPKMKIDLQKYDLSNDDNTKIILSQIDRKLKEIRVEEPVHKAI